MTSRSMVGKDPRTFLRMMSRSNWPRTARTACDFLSDMAKWLDQNITSRSTKPISGSMCLSRRALYSFVRTISAAGRGAWLATQASA